MFVRFGHYVLKSQRLGASMALLFAILPLMGWLSMMIVGLVTLRKGPKEGAWVLLWASLPVVVLAFLNYPTILIGSVLAGSVYVWAMAWVLRYCSSWTFVLEFSALAAVIVVLLLHGLLPDLPGWWEMKYQSILTQFTQDMSADALTPQGEALLGNVTELLKDSKAIENIAMIATGSVLAFVMFSKLVLLGLARWWQALLFNPKGLRPELCDVRLGYVALGAALIGFIGAWLSFRPAIDVIPIIFATFIIAGLSLIHCWVGKSRRGLTTVVLFYLLLVLFPAFMMGLLFLLAIGDSLFDLRKRWQLT